MGDGALGDGLMALVATAFGVLGLVPLAIVAAVPLLRRSVVAWAIANGMAGFTWITLSVQVRVVLGANVNSDLLFALAVLVAGLPVLLLAYSKWREDRLWPLAIAPMLVLLPWGIVQMKFRSRSEGLISAARRGDDTEVMRLLGQGADPDCFDVGQCALDLAIERRDWLAVETLIRHDATNAEYHEMEGGVPTSAAKKLTALGKRDLAEKLLANRR